MKLSKLKYSVLFFTVTFFSLGFVLDATKLVDKKEVLFGLANERSERFTRSIELHKQEYSTNPKFYYASNKGVFNWTINHDERYVRYKSFQDEIILIENVKNTMEEVLAIEKVMLENNYASAIIVTDPPHSRRVQIFIELFTKELKKDYIIVSSDPTWWDKAFYFTNWYALKFVMFEFVKIPYNLIKYGLFYEYVERSNKKI